MSVIQTMGLSKRYKDRWAVDHLDLRVEQGDKDITQNKL